LKTDEKTLSLIRQRATYLKDNGVLGSNGRLLLDILFLLDYIDELRNDAPEKDG